MTAASLVVVLGLIIPVISHVEVGLFDPLWHDRATIMMGNISLQVQPTTLTKNGLDWRLLSSRQQRLRNKRYQERSDQVSVRILLLDAYELWKRFDSDSTYEHETIDHFWILQRRYQQPSPASHPTQMSLVWVTKDAVAPTVLWGTESGKYLQSSMAASGTYSATDMCGSPATDFGFRDPGLIHRATMNNLTPGQTYYYIFGDAYGWSSEYNFKAAPYPGSSDPVTIIAYGDMGCAELDDSYMAQTVKASLNTTKRIQEQLDKIDFVLQIGDISYALGYSSMWDVYFDQLEPIATRVPYMVGIGNHERNYPNTMPGYYNNSGSGGECGIPHELRFPMPTPALDEPWYGFDYGSAHVVIMSTEHQFTEGTPQYSYLENHLKSVNRKVTPWLIFGGHRPMYIASKDTGYPDGHNSVAYALRNSLEPLLKEYKVDLALWAHIHAYQRTCAVYQETCVDGGIPHVVIGMAGRNLANCLPSSLPSWLVYYDHKSYGYSRITVNTSTLVFEYIHSDDNVVYDTLVLQK
ncbi:hypothetical protein EMCRGX_G011250 [Ephydatia muelleri]